MSHLSTVIARVERFRAVPADPRLRDALRQLRARLEGGRDWNAQEATRARALLAEFDTAVRP